MDIIIQNEADVSEDFSGYILIIPNEGCHYCIDEAFQFAKKNLNNRQIYFIITSDFDFKRSKVRFSQNELSAKNLIFDTKQVCSKIGLRQNYLILLTLKNGSLESQNNLVPDDVKKNLYQVQKSIK
ncbi:hypothetical protein [Arcicella aurantiaca]|uniref:hypothetical protein n=1 Tax=Arcicella aurantiaca TaxID=591202 RepID=UPI0011B22450|nr:hypothetical protein [Arcicella aurantiaca]